MRRALRDGAEPDEIETQVAGELVKGLPFDVVLDMLRKSPRPMVLRFVSSAFLCPSLSRANQDGLNPGRATFIA